MCKTFSISWYDLCCSFYLFFFVPVPLLWYPSWILTKEKNSVWMLFYICFLFMLYSRNYVIWWRLIKFTATNPNFICSLYTYIRLESQKNKLKKKIIVSQIFSSIWNLIVMKSKITTNASKRNSNHIFKQ